MRTQETGRVFSIVGGALLFVGLIFSLIVLSALIGPVWRIPPFLSLIIILGVLLDMVCGIILILVKDAVILLVAGIIGLLSSIIFIGGIIGAIGGILGIIGGALCLSAPSAKTPTIAQTPNAFLKKCPNCGKEIPIASEECPECGAKQG
ncbi:MAG: zinc-ribbon domain-containing protein [Candidatus Bathyarchaeia archaeon]